MTTWGGSRVTEARKRLQADIDNGSATCSKCGKAVAPGQAWDVDHLAPRASNPDLIHDPDNHAIAHRSCNRRAGQRMTTRTNKRRNAAKKGESDIPINSPTPRNSAASVPDSTQRAVAAPKFRVVSGVVRPRLETPRRPRSRSGGTEAALWIEKSGIMGSYSLLPWQRYALDRILELNPDGSLRFSVVLVTIGRQQGKSILMRAIAWWRIHQGERFGEPQQLIHVANVAKTAMEIWKPAARFTERTYGRKYAKYGMGTLEIDLTEVGHGRWLVQAGDHNAGMGYSPSMGIIDEAWNVPRLVVDDGLMPATIARNQPQILMFSTAGDGSSDLMRAYREQALQRPDGDVLLLEWSAAPEWPVDNPGTWRWASPHWPPDRAGKLAARLGNMAEAKFRTQYLNQWVQSIDGWVPAAAWAIGYDDRQPPDEVADAVAVEVAPDGERFATVAAWRVEDRVIVRSVASSSATAIWEQVEAWNPRLLLLPPPLMVHYAGRRRPTPVGTTELGRHLVGVGRAIAAGDVRHSPTDHILTTDVSCAVATPSETGMRLSIRKATGPTEAARAMVWAVGELLRPSSPRPAIRSA